MEESALVEVPCVKIEDDRMYLYRYANTNCIMILNKMEAALLLVELYKFLNIKEDAKK